MIEQGQPVIGRGKSLIAQLLSMAQTRLELVSVEVQEAKLVLMRQLVMLAIMVVCGWLAALTLILWIAFAFTTDARNIALGILFVVLIGGAIASALSLRRTAKSTALFGRIIEQLRMDRAALSNQGQ